MVGGATVVCIGSEDKYVTPKMSRPGDHVIITKGPAIEAAGLFAATFPDRIKEAYGDQIARDADNLFWQMTVVEDALTAAQIGVRGNGVTSMHDATECGVWGGLFEMAQCADVGMVIDKEKIIVQEAVAKVCELFKIDPFTSISEGTLIITARPNKSQQIVTALEEKGIRASIVGEVVEKEKGTHYYEDGREHKLVHPRVDPFWVAFGKVASEEEQATE
jgi:hydrogenase maturation factor